MAKCATRTKIGPRGPKS